MKKALTVALEDRELIELMRILLDDDSKGALDFLSLHFKGKARELLEGGWKVMIDVPGTGTLKMSGNLPKKQ